MGLDAHCPCTLDRFAQELIQSPVRECADVCTVFVAIGTSGVVEPAASFVGQTKARTFYVGPEERLNLASFDETFTGKAGELLPTLFDVAVG
jgi:NAD-dependent SIR2 family protein deacetylase